jgi:hypothetical protein
MFYLIRGLQTLYVFDSEGSGETLKLGYRVFMAPRVCERCFDLVNVRSSRITLELENISVWKRPQGRLFSNPWNAMALWYRL